MGDVRMRGSLRVRLFFIKVCILILTACGGGTSGTGGFGVTGKLSSTEGMPINGVTVNVRMDGATPETPPVLSETDEVGEFRLFLADQPSTLVLHFSSMGIESDFILENIPPSADGVTLELEYDSEGRLILEVEHGYFSEDEDLVDSSGDSNNSTE